MIRVGAVRGADGFGPLDHAPFSVAAFLGRPLVAHLATSGPTVRPVWFLWEQDVFWVITGTWSRLGQRLVANPAFELSVDSCNLADGTVRQVIAVGTGTIEPFDADRGRRKLVRYLGPDEDRWDPRFAMGCEEDLKNTRWAKLVPERLLICDLSFRPAAACNPLPTPPSPVRSG